MKTSELTGAALDYAVAKCEGRRIESPSGGVYWPELCHFSPSTTWLQCGVIIGRERIQVSPHSHHWSATLIHTDRGMVISQCGDTPLIAVCRCYVASKLGDEVEIPEELK